MKNLSILFLTIVLIHGSSSAQLGGLLKKKDKPAETESTTEKPEEKKKGGGFFQKAISKVSKLAGNAVAGASGLTAVGDLADADVIVSVGTNIYSKDLGLVFNDFLGDEWVNNGDFTMLQIASKDAYQFYKYDGVIKVNEKELKHAAMGIHTATETPSTANKKITFEKNGVVEGSFEVPMPTQNIKLLSINGQNKDVKVDFTKDVVLEFSNYSTEPNSLIRIDVVTTQIGIRTLSLVCYVKPAAKVTIPAAAFRNIENTNNFNLQNCYLSVSDQLRVKALHPNGKIPVNQMVIVGSNDGMWIDVTHSEDNQKGFTLNTGNATTVKKNAAFAKPLSFAKNVAVSSFYTYGTTYLYNSKTSYWARVETTRTKEIQFSVPDEYLARMLDDLYKKMTATYQSEIGVSIMPVGTIPALPAYANTQKFMREEVHNDDEFLKAYKGLEPTRSLTSVGNSYYGEGVLLKEAKADALLKVSLICQLSWPDNESNPRVTPFLSVDMVGESNGDFRSFLGNTHYFTLNIPGEEYVLKGKTIEYDKVFQVDFLHAQYKQALAELKAKEQSTQDYEMVWKLQK